VLHRSFAAVVAALAVLLLAAGPAPSAAPKRIVSLSPTATESLFAIGAGSQVVAVDDQSDYPKRAPRTKLSGFTPNVEAIAAYKPDLVVTAYDSGGLVAGLKKLKIPVLVQPAAKDLPAAYAQIRRLGVVTGHRRQAAVLVARMKVRITNIVRSAPKGRALSVYHELTPDYYSATSKTFIGRIYGLFGLKNIADAADSTASGFPQLSAEYIVAASPNVIVLADGRCCGQSAATVAARPGWRNIAAVRDRAIVRVDDSVASRWGPRVVDFARAVAAALKWIDR
jgi:iron complex transport system substrate-binding protein